MGAYRRPRRELMRAAFERASRGKHRAHIEAFLIRDPLEQLSIDGVFMIVRKTESLRRSRGHDNHARLREQVRRAAHASGFPPDRRYAYEVIVMNYYGIIWEYVSRIRRQRRERLRERMQATAA